jgi:hypothetical protein
VLILVAVGLELQFCTYFSVSSARKQQLDRPAGKNVSTEVEGPLPGNG